MSRFGGWTILAITSLCAQVVPPKESNRSRVQELELESPVRAEILALVTEHPGLPLTAMMDRLGIAWGTIYHHINRLSKAGLISTVQSGRRRLVYATSAPAAAREEKPTINSPMAHAIVKAVIESPGLDVAKLSEKLGEPRRSLYYHVKRLTTEGTILSDSATRYRGLVINPHRREILEPMLSGEFPEMQSSLTERTPP